MGLSNQKIALGLFDELATLQDMTVFIPLMQMPSGEIRGAYNSVVTPILFGFHDWDVAVQVMRNDIDELKQNREATRRARIAELKAELAELEGESHE